MTNKAMATIEYMNSVLSEEERSQVFQYMQALECDHSEEPELSQAWIDEINRRDEAVENGTMPLFSLEEVRRMIQKKVS